MHKLAYSPRMDSALHQLRNRLDAQGLEVRIADGELIVMTPATDDGAPLLADVVTCLPRPDDEGRPWLYVNGHLVAHRAYKEPWWLSDYKFEWDVDLSDVVKAGANTIALRVNNPHHFGGMFRRPFLYRPAGK